MKDYTTDTPVWSDCIPIVEENDLVHADNDNAAAKQLQQNVLVLRETKVDREEGKSLVSETERTEWNAMYRQATGYTDQKIADLINGAPSTLDTLGEIASAMGDNKDVVEALEEAIGTKASQKEMESLLGTKLEKTGDSKDNTITFGSSDTTTPSAWTDVDTLKSGETHKSFAQKVSAMFKNVRYLWKLLGNTDISGIGDGTVTGALNELNTGMAGAFFHGVLLNASVAGGDVLSVALSAQVGVSAIMTGERTTSLPDGSYIYGMGLVIRRASNQVWIVLFGSGHTNIAINCYTGSAWIGWRKL